MDWVCYFLPCISSVVLQHSPLINEETKVWGEQETSENQALVSTGPKVWTQYFCYTSACGISLWDSAKMEEIHDRRGALVLSCQSLCILFTEGKAEQFFSVSAHLYTMVCAAWHTISFLYWPSWFLVIFQVLAKAFTLPVPTWSSSILYTGSGAFLRHCVS